MPDYTTFFTSSNLDVFWQDVKWLLFYIAPGLMISVATVAVFRVISIITKSFRQDDEEEKDNDYDVYYY